MWDMQHAVNLIAYDCTATAEDGAVCVTELLLFSCGLHF
jgi:hypothetical protein